MPNLILRQPTVVSLWGVTPPGIESDASERAAFVSLKREPWCDLKLRIFKVVDLVRLQAQREPPHMGVCLTPGELRLPIHAQLQPVVPRAVGTGEIGFDSSRGLIPNILDGVNTP